MYPQFLKPLAVGIISICLMVPTSVLATDFQPIELSPIAHLDAALTVIDPLGVAHTYSISELEAFPTYQVSTTTPWRDDETAFAGVRLIDVLAKHDLHYAVEIRVIAENDYASVLPKRVWTKGEILIATRANDAPIPRRARGPFLFVAPDTLVGRENIIRDGHLVWMAKTISLNPE